MDNTYINISCKFCKIISTNDKDIILYQDEQIAIFNDIRPGSKFHFQCVPKTHIKNINHLTDNEIELLNHMQNKAKEYILNLEEEVDNIFLGFHIPPFYSVPHLHMHVLVPPFNSKFEEYVKYGVFFRTVENQIKRLEKIQQLKLKKV